MEIEKAYVRINSGQIHYRHVPGDGTPLVMYHRNPSTSGCYDRMMKLMVGDRPLYAFDTPGFGESFSPRGLPSIQDYRDWMLEALDVLELREVHIFGHHTGTHFATEMAIARPHQVKSLLLNGIAYFSHKARKKIIDEYGHEIPLDVNGGYVSEIWKGVSEMFSLYDMSLEMLHEEFLSALRSMDGRRQALIAIMEQDYKAAFDKVRCPVLAMYAKDDVLEFGLEDVLKARPETRSIKLGGARFFSPERDTSRTVDAVSAFIAEVDQSSF